MISNEADLHRFMTCSFLELKIGVVYMVPPSPDLYSVNDINSNIRNEVHMFDRNILVSGRKEIHKDVFF